jgi:hypothetical protein
MKIEEGKFYRNAKGQEVGPMKFIKRDDGGSHFAAGNTGHHYAANGRCGYKGIPDDTRTGLHLISEWPDTEDATADAIMKAAGRLLSDPPAFADHLQDDSDDLARIRQDRTVPVFVREGYDSLFTVLAKALHQAQDGKGAERHSNGLPFDQQPIMVIGQLVGMGFQTGQAIKKAVEAQGMVKRGEFAAAEREILGAVNYLAAVAIEINRRATKEE